MKMNRPDGLGRRATALLGVAAAVALAVTAVVLAMQSAGPAAQTADAGPEGTVSLVNQVAAMTVSPDDDLSISADARLDTGYGSVLYLEEGTGSASPGPDRSARPDPMSVGSQGEDCAAAEESSSEDGLTCSRISHLWETGKGAGPNIHATPLIALELSATPAMVVGPAGDVTYEIMVTNYTAGQNAVTLGSLVDSHHGDLNGYGDCTLPVTIRQGSHYSCSYPGTVGGTSGDPQTNTVTVTGTDERGSQVAGSDEVQVGITGARVLP